MKNYYTIEYKTKYTSYLYHSKENGKNIFTTTGGTKLFNSKQNAIRKVKSMKKSKIYNFPVFSPTLQEIAPPKEITTEGKFIIYKVKNKDINKIGKNTNIKNIPTFLYTGSDPDRKYYNKIKREIYQ